MIIRRVLLSMLGLFLALGVSFEASSADLDPGYLVGHWVIHEGDCSDPDAEFLIFRKSGAVESINAGKMEATGFWMIGDDMVNLHVIASPAFFHEDLEHMEGQFFAFPIRLFLFNIEADSFEAIGLLGEQIRRAPFSRCKA